jgi:UDP-N-acetylmuramyl pentapeptide phosphotransferase/UDP-N-acetylglucosamine-1-phosphate transferase
LVFLSAAFLVVVLAGAPGPVQTALFGTGAISVLGLIDDLQPQPAWRRLVVQFLAAALVVGAGWENLPAAWSLFGEAVPRWLLGLLSLFWLVWITNLYNFMDGIDGLAAGQAVIGASAIAIVGFAAGAPLPALLGLLLVAASLGFLAFNFPPATIFMGDVGSTAIGFFLASLPLVTERGAIPVEVAALAIALFIFDATWTLFRRLLRRERLSVAHRSHVYQRPLSLGVGHRRITLTAWAGMLVVGGAAVIYPGFGLPGRLLLIGVAAATFALLANIVAWLERTPSRGVAGRHE